MNWILNLKNGERLRCDHCTHVIEGSDVHTVIAYIEEPKYASNELGRISCESCHELQTSEDTAEVEP